MVVPANVGAVGVATRPPPLIIFVNVAFVKFAPLTLLFAKVAPVKLAPDRSVLRKLIPERSIGPTERSADRATAVGPSKYPLRTPQLPPPSPALIVGSVAVDPPVIPPPVDITPVRVAPERIVPDMSAPVNVAFVKLAFERLALATETPVSTIPARFAETKFTVGAIIRILYIP